MLLDIATLILMTHIALPVCFSSSVPYFYPLCSVAPMTQFTPAPCCLVPSGASDTCPGYIPSHPYAVVGTSLYPNGRLMNWHLLFPHCSVAVARALQYSVAQVGLAWEAGRASPSFSSPVSGLKWGEWEVDRLSLVLPPLHIEVSPPSISPLLYSLPFSSFTPLSSFTSCIIHPLLLLLSAHSFLVSLQKAFLPPPGYSSSSSRMLFPPHSLWSPSRHLMLQGPWLMNT